MALGLTLEERLLCNIVKTEDHWWWTGAVLSQTYNRRYGLIYDGERQVLAHRAAYAVWVGPIPPKLVVDHLCLEPNCVRPTHLEAVTQTENMRRSNLRGVAFRRA